VFVINIVLVVNVNRISDDGFPQQQLRDAVSSDKTKPIPSVFRYSVCALATRPIQPADVVDVVFFTASASVHVAQTADGGR